MAIFQKSIFNSLKQDESLVALRWAKFQKFTSKIDAIKGFKEEVYQDGFFKDIFKNDKILTCEVHFGCKLQKEINQTDKEIGQMVYKLYDLTEDEIKTVEGV